MLTTPSHYTDFQDLTALRREAAGKDSGLALEKAAQQFEALFTQMMLKSMRDAGGGEGMFDNEQTRLYQDMYDKQLSLHLSQSDNSIGLAKVLVRQLKESMPELEQSNINLNEAQVFSAPERIAPSFVLNSSLARNMHANSVGDSRKELNLGEMPNQFESPEDFVSKLWPYAKQAAEKLGVDPRAILAQAALETGWGKHVIRHADGSSSHNLFNIKADHRWNGSSVNKMTLEYRDGIAAKEHASFRAYDSYEDSFNDYVHFLQASGRYQQALDAGDDTALFADRLQQAGYATDPAYASKINGIVNGEHISNTLASIGLQADTHLA